LFERAFGRRGFFDQWEWNLYWKQTHVVYILGLEYLVKVCSAVAIVHFRYLLQCGQISMQLLVREMVHLVQWRPFRGQQSKHLFVGREGLRSWDLWLEKSFK
jgi:hypothetical protein